MADFRKFWESSIGHKDTITDSICYQKKEIYSNHLLFNYLYNADINRTIQNVF